jgi:hypothetical protein
MDLTRQDWDDLLDERLALMTVCGGLPDNIARSKAYQDTTKMHGLRPAKEIA